MGQDQSSPIDEAVPPDTLQSRTVEGLAEYIKSGGAQRIVVMTGAGISTSAGIPDFRSPETGLYANLARLSLPYAEAVFSISYFRESPEPFNALAQELYPGKYRPTITHYFIRLLHDKGLLLKLFTQNIDCLEREAGVPGEKIIEAHGSFAGQRCIECKASHPDDLMKIAIRDETVPHCGVCSGLVKPNIVFFGEALPQEFFLHQDLPREADLCIVMGTSLTVQPFASLPFACREGTPRVLINQEMVGDLGCRADDVLLLGDCDGGVRRIAEACGWLEELEALWAQTSPTSVSDLGREKVENGAKTKEEEVEEEVDILTREVEAALKKTENHNALVNGYVSRNGPEKTTSPARDEVDRLTSQIGSSLNLEESRQDYLDRQEKFKTGDSQSDTALADRLAGIESDQKEPSPKGTTAVPTSEDNSTEPFPKI